MNTDDQRIDVIVVGTGPGGATVAKELSQRNKKVLILEWGDNAPLTGSFWQGFKTLLMPGKCLLFTNQLLGMVRGITELVGRRPEMEALVGALKRAREEEGQVVDVAGEAGIGKSRLVYEFQRMFDAETIFLTGNCVQYGRNINFLPVVDIVKGALSDWSPDG